MVLGLLVNCLLAACLLSGVPRLRMPARRLVPSMLLVAIGLTMLSHGRAALHRLQRHRPAYQVVGGTVALLLFLYLFNQMLLFGAALAATSDHGTVQDLAAGPPPAGDTPTGGKASKPARRIPVTTMMVGVGALVTLELPADSPIRGDAMDHHVRSDLRR